MSKPYLPDDEPTEAAVCRQVIAFFDEAADAAESIRAYANAEYDRTRARAIRACMRAAGWRTDEPPEDTGLPGGQSILDAG